MRDFPGDSLLGNFLRRPSSYIGCNLFSGSLLTVDVSVSSNSRELTGSKISSVRSLLKTSVVDHFFFPSCSYTTGHFEEMHVAIHVILWTPMKCYSITRHLIARQAFFVPVDRFRHKLDLRLSPNGVSLIIDLLKWPSKVGFRQWRSLTNREFLIQLLS